MENLAYTVILIRARHLHATTLDPQEDWQETLHKELGSGAYQDILRRIGAQTENCSPDSSIDELAQRWCVREYYKEPDDSEEPPLPLHDITQGLRAENIRTDFETPEGLDYLKTLACIASGVNQTRVSGMAEKHQDEVMDILRQTVPQLEARRKVGRSALLSGVSMFEMVTTYERACRKARESNSDFEGKTTLAIRPKQAEE